MMTNEQAVRDDFLDDLLGDFLDESTQLLVLLNENLLELDEWVGQLCEEDSAQVDLDLINDMFRSAHSIKGLSGMLGLTNINCLTHKIENVFDATRKGELLLNENVVELMFEGCDRLGAMVEQLRETQDDNVECEKLLEDIANMLIKADVEQKQSSQADAEKALDELMENANNLTDLEEATSENNVFDGISTDASPTKSIQSIEQTDHFAGIVDGEVPAKYLSIFIDECDLTIDGLSDRLLSTEGCDSPEALNDLLINAHRIKGSAASIGLNRLAKLAHLMEDILQELRDTNSVLTDNMTEALLLATDAIRNYNEGLKQGSPCSNHFNQFACGLLSAKSEAAASEDSENTNAKVIAAESTSQPASGQANQARFDELLQLAPTAEDSYCAEISFQENLPLVGLKAQLIYEKISRMADVFYSEPASESLDSLEKMDTFYLGFQSSESVACLESALKVSGVQRIELNTLQENSSAGTLPNDKPNIAEPENEQKTEVQSSPEKVEPINQTPTTESATDAVKQPTPTPAKSNSPKPRSTAKPAETLRVDIERLDQLMNLAGQLVINKARFTRIGEGLQKSMPSKQTPNTLADVQQLVGNILQTLEQCGESRNLQSVIDSVRNHTQRVHQDIGSVLHDIQRVSKIHTSINDLTEAVHQLDRVADGIQKSVMDTRMVPIGPLFTRFKRVIRDISRSNQKEIRLEIKGEKTELDKRMIDELGDPLIHMVRNSADHGIESPEEREAAGKPRQGLVTLEAFHRGNSIVIQITDDGKGLNLDKIISKAVEKGVVSEADIQRMTPHQIYQLVWEPGFSTADQVTEISGRGMGMDIVRSKIEDINGMVDLDSTPGKGATFTIKLPLTMAILPSLLAEIKGDVFALPVESVIEIVKLTPDDFSSVQQMITATIRGRVVSVISLDEIFQWNCPEAAESTSDEDQDSILVIVGSEGKEVGLRVNSLLGEEDIVIKSMADNYKNVAGIAGASILGDGRVSLILDPAALIDLSSGKEIILT